MSTITHPALPDIEPDFDLQEVTPPDPDPLKEPGKPNLMMRIFPAVMAVVMIGFFILLFTTGQRTIQPMALMMPMGMLMGVMSVMAVGGTGGGTASEQNSNRLNFFIKLREQRKLTHLHGRQVHALQSAVYPHHKSLLSRCGTEDMWRVGPSSGSSKTADEEFGPEPQAMNPYLCARIGTGVSSIYPQIRERPQQVKENLEPVTASAWRRFMRTQKYVINCPLGLSLRDHTGYAILGDPEERLGLARAMIMSLSFNHAPTNLSIGLITKNPNAKTWDWLKWLPHLQDRNHNDGSGTARYAWKSMAEYAKYRARQHNTDSDQPHMVVFIDTPDTIAALPPGTPTAGTTFVVLRAQAESLANENSRIKVTSARRLSVPGKPEFATADWASIAEARVFAQRLSRYRPRNWTGTSTEVVEDNEMTFFDVAGITDIDTFDPRPIWKSNDNDSNFRAPIGFAHDGTKKLKEIIYIDHAEAEEGGTGPHGSVQGKTGTGKSFLLNGIILLMCVLFSPEKLNLILMDFKGGLTFKGFEKLPHVVVNISNLESDTELVMRAQEVIVGEMERRMQLLNDWGCPNAVIYRKKRRRNPKMPVLPALFIVVDEFKKYVTDHPENLAWFAEVGSLGRALDVHAIVANQDIEPAILRGLFSHLTWGISLKSSDGAHSRNVLKITDAAKDLPAKGRDGALLYKDNAEDNHVATEPTLEDARLSRFVGFDHSVKVRRQRRRSGGSAGTSNSGNGPLFQLRRFCLSNNATSSPKSKAPTTKDQEPDNPTGEDDFDLPDMRDLLIDRIAKFDSVKALKLWQPTLRAPLSFHDIKIEPAHSDSRFELRIGDTDVPRKATRLPYTLTLEGTGSHVRILGAPSSGRSTAIEAIVGSACQAYSPSACSFSIIEYGGVKLAEIKDMPNVNGYAQKFDTDSIDRFFGEFMQILEFRQREFARRGVDSFEAYLQSRAAHPTVNDRYGRMILVVDGLDNYRLAKDSDPNWADPFLRIVTEGTAFGLHLIVTMGSNAALPTGLQDKFGSTIHLKVEDVTRSVYMASALKKVVEAIPDDQPGRCVDMSRGLSARILVPQDDKIEPTSYRPVSNDPIYETRSYGEGIRRFVERMRVQYPLEADPSASTPQPGERAVPIRPVAQMIEFDDVWGAYSRTALSDATRRPSTSSRRPAMDIHIPIGISAETIEPVTVFDKHSPHALVIGDNESGRTTFVRTVLQGITRQFGPDEAKIAIVESDYKLFEEQEELRKSGYLLGYAMNKDQLVELAAQVKELIDPRNPDPSRHQDLSPRAIKDRAWYSGPEVFFIIENPSDYLSTGYGSQPMDAVVELVKGRNDLGLHVYATADSARFANTHTNNKLYSAMEAQGAPFMLLSGPFSDGPLWPGTGIRFASGRRPGLCTRVNTKDKKTELVQLAFTPELTEQPG